MANRNFTRRPAARSIDRVALVGVASGLGAPNPGCSDGPARLRLGGLEAELRGRGIDASWTHTVFPESTSGASVHETVSRLNRRLAARIARIVRASQVPLVLGGDHSCAAGTWQGVATGLGVDDGFGLIWIDAHLDAHTPATSPSGRLHGMPLAALLGREMNLLGTERRIVSPQHLCVVGVRSSEVEEAALLESLGVRVYAMPEIAQRGLQVVMREALERATAGSGIYGVSVDLDAIDPHDAPGVGSPVPQGLRAAELLPALAEMVTTHMPVAVEIAEFNPHRDRGGATLRLVGQLAAALLGGEKVRDPMKLEQRYSAHNYDSLPVVLVRGMGAWIWDRDGRRYLDMMSAYSAVSHGHAHPRILRALTEQARRLAVTSRAYYNDCLPPFLERLCTLTGMARALPVNTGLEAVETALKAARKWAYKVKGVPAGMAELIACEGNFHGRSIAIVAMSSEEQYRDGFAPFPGGSRLVPFGDIDALERAITPNTAAFLVEPIQGERGIILPPPGYLAACARLCAERNVLFIADEVQTGLGRTGKLLACEHDGVMPDGLILGKALGGGMLPVSAFLAREDVMGVFQPGDHGSTFGGNPLGAAVALEALNVLVEERLVERAASMGAYLHDGLAAIRSPLVTEIRGRGLLIGMEVDARLVSARTVVERLLAHGILSKDTHGTVVRFAPPLVIEKAQVDWALAEVRRVLEELERGVKKAA